MQQALPYRNWVSSRSVERPIGRPSMVVAEKGEDPLKEKESCRDVKGMVRENAVLLIGKNGCCMCHVMKRLLLGLGANPTVCEVDEEEEIRVVNELGGKEEGKPQFPAAYIGGRLFGGLDQLMAAHISGELTPILKKAGALWL